jgi:hypothetical protein
MRRVVTCCLLLVAAATSPALAVADQGMTSELHRKNIGRIVWAKERIRMDAQDRIPLASGFQFGEPIYGRAFFPKSIVTIGEEKSCPNSRAEFRLRLYVDGVDKGLINRHYMEGKDWTTIQVTLKLTPGDEGDTGNVGVPDNFAEIVETMAPGLHKIRVEFIGQAGDRTCSLKLAEGEFTFQKSDQPVQTTAAGQKLPPALMKNSALESSMIQAVKDRGWKNEEPVKVVILERDWRMIRNPFGTITHREINTHVVLRKFADRSIRANDISFRQEARPGNAWGPTEVYGIGTKSYPVDPSELK